MTINNLPADINAEILLDYYSGGTFDVRLKGLHKRNAYNDILSVSNTNDRIRMSLGRNSLYNSLPEFLFHPIDRFDLPQHNKKERFAEECLKQEREIENAYRFFLPIDLALLLQRLNVRHNVQDYTTQNKALIDILADSLTEKQRNNRFILLSLVFFPHCKTIRGDRTLITLMLRKVLAEEGLVVETRYDDREFSDKTPGYPTELGSSLSSFYVGNGFSQPTFSYSIYYWNQDECNENFNQFVDEIDEYRQFLQDYFVSVEAIIEFSIYCNAPALRLSDTTIYNYLNYNTNI